MDEKDKKEVKNLFLESFKEIWEDNIAPGAEAMLDERINPLPTKSYLDRKIAELQGDLGVKLRREDQKLNRLTEILKDKNVLSDRDFAELSDLRVFPQEG